MRPVPLDPRKQRVLKLVTVDYIGSAEPVASQTIARKYDLGVSPATIRNDMADLETDGYLRQPHTSAGRIPSDKGYRFYVDVLMEPESLLDEEERRVRATLADQAGDLEAAFRYALRFLSLLTDYAAVAFAPHLQGRAIRHLHLVPLDPLTVVITLVTDPGFVQSRVVELSSPLAEGTVEALSQALTRLFRGTTLGEAARAAREEVGRLVGDPALRRQLLELLGAEEEHPAKGGIQSDGATKLFKHPEFHDVDRVREFLSLLEGQDSLVDFMARLAEDGGVRVSIGEENPTSELQSYSLVLAPLACQGKALGTVGIIGPTRMTYGRSISVVSLVAECLGGLLERFGR